jgi:exodeoxyribonuclease VII small subunit
MTRDNEPPRRPGFEETLTELESLVDTLEKGDLSLEDSLTAFERGIRLTRDCQKALDEAEQKVRVLSERPDEIDPGTHESDG